MSRSSGNAQDDVRGIDDAITTTGTSQLPTDALVAAVSAVLILWVASCKHGPSTICGLGDDANS